jgi:N-hydroxyarylamine O-acetyltransferase
MAVATVQGSEARAYCSASYGYWREQDAALTPFSKLLSRAMDIDLPAYFARVGYAGTGEPTLATLRELQLCHLSRIPFESVDPFLGIPVNIDLAAIQSKLIGGRRGGYCHEHNLLFHDVLQALGSSVTALGGRVFLAPMTLTHRLTLVELPEGSFIADVGFGGRSPTMPICLEPNLEQATPFGVYRLVQKGEYFDLETGFGGQWQALYRFNLQAQSHVDFEVANWFTSTHPRSLFTQNLVVCRLNGNTRANMLNSVLSVRNVDGSTDQITLTSAQHLGDVMGSIMGLALPVPAEMLWTKLQKQ